MAYPLKQPAKFLTMLRFRAAQLFISFALMVDFLRSPLKAAGKCHWELENEDMVVMSPSFCVSPLVYMKMGFFGGNLAFPEF